MRAILLLALKDQKLLFRDKGGLFWTFGFPLIFAALFGAMFSGVFNASSGSGIAIAIAIVDQEPSAESRSFVERLDANPSVSVDHMSLADAERAVRLRRKTAYLILAAPTTAAPGLKFTIGIDPSRQAAAGMLRGILMEATLADKFPSSAVTNSAPDIPGAPRIDVVDVTRKARTRDRITSAYQITFPSAQDAGPTVRAEQSSQTVDHHWQEASNWQTMFASVLRKWSAARNRRYRSRNRDYEPNDHIRGAAQAVEPVGSATIGDGTSPSQARQAAR